MENTFGLPNITQVESQEEFEFQTNPQEPICEEETMSMQGYSDLETLITAKSHESTFNETILQLYSTSRASYIDELTFKNYGDYTTKDDHFFYFKNVTIDRYLDHCLLTPLMKIVTNIG
jgi:hypothetical protein